MKQLVLIVLLVACGKKGSDSDHFGNWKAADTKAALQGAWVGPSPTNLVNRAAFEITGDVVKVSDGTTETSYTLVLEAPCKLGLKDTKGATSYMGIVMKDGQPRWGGGDTGLRTGSHAVMCAGFSEWSIKDGKCMERSMSGRWKEGKCGFRQKDGKEEFFWNWMDKEKTAPMEGDVLFTDKDYEAKKVADFAAAKAALEKK